MTALTAQGHCEGTENYVAIGGEVYLDDASVNVYGVLHSTHEATHFSPVDQPDHGVVPDLEALGKFADAGPFTVGEAFDCQEKLVLLWGQTEAARFKFGLARELPQRMAEQGELLIFALDEFLTGERLCGYPPLLFTSRFMSHTADLLSLSLILVFIKVAATHKIM